MGIWYWKLLYTGFLHEPFCVRLKKRRIERRFFMFIILCADRFPQLAL